MRLLCLLIPTLLFSCKEHRSDPVKRGVEKVVKNENRKDADTTGSTGLPADKWARFETHHRFRSFATSVYTGKLKDADFSSIPGASDARFQERFLRQMDSINFAGHYTIVEFGCGAMCSGIYIVNRKTGKIYSDLPVNKEGRWGFRYEKDSKLLIANSELIENDTLSRYGKVWQIQPELYEWTGRDLRRLQ